MIFFALFLRRLRTWLWCWRTGTSGTRRYLKMWYKSGWFCVTYENPSGLAKFYKTQKVKEISSTIIFSRISSTPLIELRSFRQKGFAWDLSRFAQSHTTLYNMVNLLLRDVILVNLGFHMCSHCLSMLIPFLRLKEHIERIDLVWANCHLARLTDFHEHNNERFFCFWQVYKIQVTSHSSLVQITAPLVNNWQKQFLFRIVIKVRDTFNIVYLQ